jgi:xanthine dehydrogenase accessory factor
VQATVVRVQRPTSVRPGDSALVLADGTIEGFVGGVCAEESVRLHALRVLETGEPLLLRLTPSPGTARTPRTARSRAQPVPERRRAGDLPPAPAPGTAARGRRRGARGRALAELGRGMGFEVASEPGRGPGGARRRLARARRGGGARGRADDGVPYVGLVASARRGAAVRAALDVPDALRARLHSPAGLRSARGPRRRSPSPSSPRSSRAAGADPAAGEPARGPPGRRSRPGRPSAGRRCCHHHGAG